MGAWAGAQALADSGYDVERDPTRIGAIIGSGEGGLGTHWDMIDRLRNKGFAHCSPFYITNVIPNSPAAFLAMERNLQGPSFAISSACASSNHAFGTAISLIKSGMADAILAGGSEAVATPPSIAAFGVIGALSSRNDDPDTASRPFDRDRDGFVMGEGSGVLLLEELEHAKARGARIYAEITGFGFTTDAFDLVAPHPEGLGAARSIRNSLAAARLNPEDISLINCHGTSTPVGDQAECLAIHHAFGDELAKKIPVHSTKSMIGHLIGAAGAVEAIAAIMAFERGVVHQSRNCFNQDPAIDLNVLKENASGRQLDHILSNAFGFGGHNASLILSRFKG
jgi:3-oxoacyl-[acyl-carrier-protein] synthase II